MRRFVLFDFDGVIGDTFAFAQSLAKRVCVLNEPDVYRAQFEGNIFQKLSEIDYSSHGADCDHHLDWWSEYVKAVDSTKPFPGIVDAIRTLGQSHSLCIVTSSTNDFIEPFIKKHFGTDPFLDILDHTVHRSKVVKMGMLFEKYGFTSSDSVFVTDTLGDMYEAKEHEMGVVACSWGFHPRATLERGVPFRIVDAPDELPQAVDDYFARSAA